MRSVAKFLAGAMLLIESEGLKIIGIFTIAQAFLWSTYSFWTLAGFAVIVYAIRIVFLTKIEKAAFSAAASPKQSTSLPVGKVFKQAA